MSPTHSTKKNRRYGYYFCQRASKTGWKNCPTKQIPAGEIERYVVPQIKSIGADPSLIEATIREANREAKESLKVLDPGCRIASLEVRCAGVDIRTPTATANRQADLHERLAGAERRATEIHQERAAALVIDPEEVATALRDFAPIWEMLTPQEQTRVVALLIARVDYDGKTGTVVVTFNPTGGGMRAEGKITVDRVGKRKVIRAPRKPVGPRIPRISRLMALAIKMQGMVDRGEVPDYAELARLAQVTRARMTQIMDLNLLSPQLQEWLLFLEPVEGGRYSIRLMGLQAVCLETDWGRQPSLTNY